MLRRLLGLLCLVPCHCGHPAAVHHAPYGYRLFYECTDCAAIAARERDWHRSRLTLVAARHPYAVC